MAPLAAAVRDELAPIAARKDVTLALDIEPETAAAGDAFLLHRALSNLVRNAIDFAPRRTTVTIGAYNRKKQVEFTVRDHGPGLPDYARHRAFEKFFSLPRPDSGKKGTGLGLAFVKEVAALHGGRATLANHPEGGAVAVLTVGRAAT
jgi:two-component system sensor histidine kinase CreC